MPSWRAGRCGEIHCLVGEAQTRVALVRPESIGVLLFRRQGPLHRHRHALEHELALLEQKKGLGTITFLPVRNRW